MKIIEKQAILKYLKNCIVDDSKENLSIELDSYKLDSWKLFLPDVKKDFFNDENFEYLIDDLNDFYGVLSKEWKIWYWKERSWLKLENILELHNEIKEYFYRKAYFKFKNINSKYKFIDYISFDDNNIRNDIIRDINNHMYYLNSDKEFLTWQDLEKLFFSWDKKDYLEKIEFFWNENFLDFYDKNKIKKIYICLEHVITEKNKKIIFQPLYFIEVEVQEDKEEHFFSISISESNVSFNFFVEHLWKKLFKLENKQEKDEWFELEKDIDWLSIFKSKIDLYKSNIVKDFDKENIKKSPCLISANDIWFIKWLIKEYNNLIDNKDLNNLDNIWLWIIFNESKFEKNHIDKLTNFTLLNREQQDAVKYSLENKLSVIVWPPWTWKSQVVVNIMLNAYINNKTILFASKNNTAVDTVLKKIADLDLSYYPFLRLWSKNSQDEWYPKIKNKLLKEVNTHYIDFKDIENLKELLSSLEQEITNVEKSYLEYYEAYEKLELILNYYEQGFKDYIYKESKLNIDFDYIRNIKNNFLKLLEKLEKQKKELTNKNNEIEKTKLSYSYLSLIEKNIISWKFEDIDFEEILKWLSKKKSSINKHESYINEQEKKYKSELKKNLYNKFIENISSDLHALVIKSNFIDYSNVKISDLKEIHWDVIEAEEFGFFKKLFWFKSRQIKNSRKIYYNIVEKQKNQKIQEYFLDIDENINNNELLYSKLKELIWLKWFEEKFIKYNKLEAEYKNSISNYKSKLKDLNNDYFNFIKSISKYLFIDFNKLSYEEIIKIIKNIKNLYILIYEKKSIEDSINSYIKKKFEFIKEKEIYFNKYLNKNIIKYIVWNINENNFISVLDNILKLENINIEKENISNLFNELTSLERNITEINNEVFDVQWRLKDKSLDYLSYLISENINDIKPKLTDSVDKIYNVFSFIKNWWDSKDTYLVEKYKKLFDWIKIFITTNLSTTSLPLEWWFYDYLIIDEASQNDIASVIPMLYRVKNVIIIWDPNQLKHITKLKENDIVKIFYKTLKKEDLNDKDYAEDFKDIYNFNNSVFNSFESIYKSKLNKGLITLNEHYRCHDDIINYSNFIVWEYNLFPKIYWNNKHIKNTQIPIWIHWIEDIKNDNEELNKVNETEAKAIIKYLKQILQTLGDKISIWIIAPFRNQVNYIKKLIRDNKLEWYENVLVDTVHKFQWDEKDIILFSTVYPNAKSSIFLNDVNLLNVAVSRARNSFLIFWDKQAIKNYKWDNWEELLYTTLIRYTDSVKRWNEIVKYNKYDTQFEKQFFEELTKAWIKFDYQYPIYEWKYNLDFRIKLKWVNNYINLELDWWVHNNKRSYDYTRNKKVEQLWFKVIRYSNSYMKENMWEIIEWLKKICELINNKSESNESEEKKSDNKIEINKEKKFDYKTFVNNKYLKPIIQYQKDKIQIIDEANKLNKNIKFTYKNSKWEYYKREIKIIEYWEFEYEWIKFFGIKWYCKLRNEERIFNLKSMRQLEIV